MPSALQGVKDAIALTRALQRTKQTPPPQTFYLNTKRQHITDPQQIERSQFLWIGSGWFTYFVIALPLLLCLEITAFSRTPLNSFDAVCGRYGLWIVFSLTVIGSVFEYAEVRRITQYVRQLRQGRLLTGEIVNTAHSIQRNGKVNVIWLDVTYQFVSPHGNVLQGKSGWEQRGVVPKVPPPGTPVKVVYVSPMLHTIL